MKPSFFLLALFLVTGFGCTAKVTTTGLNLRTGPGTTYPSTRTVPINSEVCVESVSNGWARLNNGLFCSDSFLRPKTTPTTPAAKPCTTKYTTADTLRIRAGPGTTYTTVMSVPKGTAVCVVETTGDWAKLNTNNYCSAAYLTTTKPASTVASPTSPSTPTTVGDKRKCTSFWNQYSKTRYPTRSEFVAAFKGLSAGKTISYTQSTARWSGIDKATCPPALPASADCSSFVTWAFWTAFGGTTDILNNLKWSAGNTSTLFANGSLVSTTSSGCQEADLIGYSGHVAIYAGNNKVLNYGSTGPIKNLTYNYKAVKGCYRYNLPFGKNF